MAYLPSEIIIDILSRLAVKSLVRFKCVCKSWNSLMKTPNFIKLHLNQTLISSSDFHLLKWSKYCSSMYSAELDFHHNHLYFSKLHHPLQSQGIYLGSCNGVVCISNTSKNDVVLFNPLTKSHLKLPAPSNRIPKLEHDVVLYGFGYDSKTDDYKVLKIVQGVRDNLFLYNKAEVFSVNIHQWKSVQTIPYCPIYKNLYGVLVNEALHYMVINEESDSKLCRFIASFDLRTESFSLMDFPCYDDKLRSNSDYVDFFLKELGGCLSVMVNYHTYELAHTLPFGNNDTGILYCAHLWVMKEYGNKQSWVKLFTVSSIFMFTSIGSILCLKPIVNSKDGRRLLIDIDNFEYGWYNLVSNEITKLTSHGLPDKSLNSEFFMGTLVSLQDKLHSMKGSLPMKNRNRKNSDKFLSVGFKLKL